MSVVLRDRVLDAEIRRYADDASPVPPGSLVCTDPTHPAEGWNGLACYVHRVARGLSRAGLRDALRRAGRDVTVGTIAGWERAFGPDVGPSLLEGRALAGVLGVDLGALVACAPCWRAACERAIGVAAA